MKEPRIKFLLIYVACILLVAASGNINWNQIRSTNRHGTGAYGQSSDGTGATNAIPKYDSAGNLIGSGVSIDSSNNISTPGQYNAGVGSSTTGAMDLTGKTSGSTVTLTVADATAAGTITVPGKTGTMSYVAAAGTAGHCTQYDTDGIGTVDAGAACGAGGVTALTRISQQVLGGAASSVTFSSIPGTYSNLVLEGITRLSNSSGNSSSMSFQFNGDTGTNYGYSYMLGNGTAPSTGKSFGGGNAFFANVTNANSVANWPGTFKMFIPGYAQTTFIKETFTSSTYMNATTTAGELDTLTVSNFWSNTSAITQIVLLPASGNFVAGSVFTLYGEQ